MEGHHKNECPTFVQYMAAGMPNLLPQGGLWCEICKKLGHDPYHCTMMQKYQTVPKSSYCTFCKSVGHDDKDCRTMELMRERTSDAYRVQAEMMTGQATPQFNQVPAPYNTVQQQYNTAQQPYNNTQPQYNPTQPQYNTVQYNQAPQYNTER
jgi:alpha-acetolactate decarboxylase